MPVGTLDQHQDSTGSSFGFGQFASGRYRGQCFTPAIAGKLGTIGFDRIKGTTDIKVYIDSTTSHVPTHAVGSELYSFTITNANLVTNYSTYDLPTPLTLNVGTEYCFYLAPFVSGAYSDDYQDVHGVSSGTLEMTNNNGVWSNENLTFHYATYMITLTPQQLIPTEQPIFQPTEVLIY